MGGENGMSKLMVCDKGREIAYKFLWQAAETPIGENQFIVN